jgi:hypothetical protein
VSGQGATRDPHLEFMRGALVALLLSSVLVSLPALRSIDWAAPADTPWAALARLRPLDGLFILSLAVVAGSVFGQTARVHGLARCSGALLRRAGTYYLAFVAIAALVAAARWLPTVETLALTQRTDVLTGLVGSTYPNLDDRISYQLFELIFLRAGPDQLQLLALCVVLLALAPLLAWPLLRGHVAGTLAASAALAALALYEAHADSSAPAWLGLPFEQRYSLAHWQLVFAVAFTLGWLRPRWLPWARQHRVMLLLGATGWLLAAVALWLAATPAPGQTGARPVPVGADVALALALGLPLLVAGHALLGLAWAPLRRSFGHLLLPLGQEPLAVFVLHGAWLLVFLQFPPLPPVAAIAALATSWFATWALVHSRSALRWLPH